MSYPKKAIKLATPEVATAVIQRSRIITSSLRKCDSRLFVYGTLRPFAAVPMARWLAKVGIHLGAARTPGRLYDLGPYPGMTLPRRSGEWVTGEVYRVPAGRIWQFLDRYEAGESGRSGPLFVRVLRPLEMNGKRSMGWLYLYRRSTLRGRRIAAGDYLDFVRAGHSLEQSIVRR